MADLQGKYDRLAVHQVHAAKLAVDIGAAAVSSALLWRGRSISGLAVRYLAPVLGSVGVLASGDLDRLAATRRGRYVQRHMPPSMVTVRFAGDVVMCVAAARRRPRLLAAGLLIVAAGWSHGLAGRPRPAGGRGRHGGRR